MIRPRATLPTLLLVLALVLALALAACGGATAGDPATGDPAAGGANGLTVDAAWARASTRIGGITAAYLSISNAGPAADRLIGVATSVAEVVEIHETVRSDGMMGMRPVASVPIPAGGTVAMEPGGTHVMLIGLTGELRAGSSFQITLTFERAGTVAATVGVRG